MKCCICDSQAIAVFNMPGGCVVYPELKVQPLCPQHIITATPLDGMYFIEDLRLDKSIAVPELQLPKGE